MPLVVASSFADPADVAAFRRCKAAGHSDQLCFKVGDNGIGAWGANCAQDHSPMCALPYEVWHDHGHRGGDSIKVTYKGVTVFGILGDTMPHLGAIHNGAGIDLNPAFAKALGVTPPFLLQGVTWDWA